jgi:hypothetical protein
VSVRCLAGRFRDADGLFDLADNPVGVVDDVVPREAEDGPPVDLEPILAPVLGPGGGS